METFNWNIINMNIGMTCLTLFFFALKVFRLQIFCRCCVDTIHLIWWILFSLPNYFDKRCFSEFNHLSLLLFSLCILIPWRLRKMFQSKMLLMLMLLLLHVQNIHNMNSFRNFFAQLLKMPADIQWHRRHVVEQAMGVHTICTMHKPMQIVNSVHNFCWEQWLHVKSFVLVL